ncbi:MAG TPA: DDE-type integrase/transposase/recombinase [Terriglobia bacterium]|nr:DDE-type integrase/transposase/recombinase [Terriglobia bacterium]
MITSFLHEMNAAQSRTGLSRRALLAGLPRSTIQRWRSRQRAGAELLQKPGPKKSHAPDWPALLTSIKDLSHGRERTAGTTALWNGHCDAISRRDFQQLVQQERDHRLLMMPRIYWLQPGTAWSIDATEYESHILVPLVDLASRYRFHPLVSSTQNGEQIASFLDAAFRQHGAPLFLKRDNGSPFNCASVDAVLAEHKVLPLNSPPHYPPYNGAMEKSIGDFKHRLSLKMASGTPAPLLSATVEATVHELNHQRRRSLHGRTACELFHDPALRRSFPRRFRDELFRLLEQTFRQNLQSMADKDHHAAAATAWRRTVESWLRCQGLIRICRNAKTNEPVSTTSPKKWSHN